MTILSAHGWLWEALARNYLNNVARGKQVLEPVVFQGGGAANVGIRAALERALGEQVVVPPHFGVTGAIAAMLAHEAAVAARYGGTRFRGFEVGSLDFRSSAFECSGCPNLCEVVEVRSKGKVLARWDDRCGKWSMGVAPVV